MTHIVAVIEQAVLLEISHNQVREARNDPGFVLSALTGLHVREMSVDPKTHIEEVTYAASQILDLDQKQCIHLEWSPRTQTQFTI